MPQISIIVPVYKVESHISHGIDSILAQTFTDFELIMVDDGSPDASGSISDDYAVQDSRLISIHKKNGGVSSARNVGLDHAEGNLITFVDSDDAVSLQYLQMLYEALVTNKTQISLCGIFRGKDLLQFYQNTTNDLIQTMVLSHKDIYFYPQYDAIPTSSSIGKLFCKRCFDNIKFPEGIAMGEDMITMQRIFINEKFISCVFAPLYFYYENSNSVMHQKWNAGRLDEIEMLEQQLMLLDGEDWHDVWVSRFRNYLRVLEKDWRCVQRDENITSKDRLILKRKYHTALKAAKKNKLISKSELLHKYSMLCPCLAPFFAIEEKISNYGMRIMHRLKGEKCHRFL